MLNRITRWYIVAPVITFCLLLAAFHTTAASDIAIASNYPVHSEEIKDVAELKVSIDLAWTLLCGFLVFNMQAGFAFLGAGFLQKKNTLNYLTMSFMD
ncbi:MAG: ammonium transporter, partial [Candidatus Scalindua sp.]|nr:ammonium transporter [Candidatus Scalindua sp.]